MSAVAAPLFDDDSFPRTDDFSETVDILGNRSTPFKPLIVEVPMSAVIAPLFQDDVILRQIFHDEIEVNRKYGPDSKRKHKDKMFNGPTPLLKMFANAEIIDPTHGFGFADAIVMSIESLTVDVSDKSAYTNSAKKILTALMNLSLIPNNDRDRIRAQFIQHRRPYQFPRTLAPEQIAEIATGEYSGDPFIQARSKASYVVLGKSNASRSEVEYERFMRRDIRDLGAAGIAIIITGKKGSRRPNMIHSDDAAVFREYLRQRDAIVASSGIDEPALFIRKIPKYDKKTGRHTLALTRSGHYGVFKRFRDNSTTLKSVQPYDLRRHGISRMATTAAVCQIPLEQVADRVGNSVRVLRDYNNAFDLFNQLMGMEPAELICYLKDRIYHEWQAFKANVTAIEHIGCLVVLILLLGRARFFQMLSGL